VTADHAISTAPTSSNSEFGPVAYGASLAVPPYRVIPVKSLKTIITMDCLRQTSSICQCRHAG